LNIKNLFTKKALTEEEFAEIFEAFYFLREAEINEKEALHIIAKEQTKPAAQNLLAVLLNAPSFIEGLSQFPNYAPEYVITLLRQGQKNKEEVKVLASLSEHFTKILFLDEEGGTYKQRLKKHLTYPVAILVVAFIISTVLFIFVVPVFDEIFQSFGAELPALTQLVVRLSELMQQWWWLCVGLIWLGLFCFNHKMNQRFRSKLALYFSAIRYVESFLILRTLHLLLSYDFNLQEALRLSATVSKNTLIIEALNKSADAVAEKKSFVDYLKEKSVFPNKILPRLRIFEKTNRFIILQKLINRNEFILKKNLSEASKIMNSVIMVIMGIIVGIFIIAMYLPIFSMGAAVIG